jgi:hypothetical protein
VDLPVSRTGLSLHHSPRFKVEPRPGRFRVEVDRGPWSPALSNPAAPSPPAVPFGGLSPSSGYKDLLDKFRQEAGRTTAGVIPVQVRVPQLGPAVFLAAELTAETGFPSVEMDYKRMGGR